MVKYPEVGDPEINLRPKSNPITLRSEMSLSDFEKELKNNGDAKKRVEFVANDGIQFSKTTKIQHVLSLPYFLVRVDGNREYNFMSEKSFSFKNSKLTMNSDQKNLYDTLKDFDMRD